MAIGQVVGTHGVRGELRIRLYNPGSATLAEADEVFLGGKTDAWRAIRSARAHRGVWLVRMEGVETPEEGRTLVGETVAVREADLPKLADGEFYHYQLIGLEVVDEHGNPVGRVREVLSAKGNDVLALDSGSGERLIPLVDDVVREVDLRSGRIVARLVEGL